MSIEPGTRFGHYETVELIGKGGMGEVYKARDPRLNRMVALKILRTQVSDKSEARTRFEREAQTIANLNHPNICVAYDIGREHDTDFLVMELLEGETLAQRLERGPLPLPQALKCAIDLADALDKAHRLGVTHRDLKPGNVMLTRNGPKLLDFGLAKLRQLPNVSGFSTAPTRGDITEEGTILGTVQYMAPEQLEGGEADARTDIFSLGAVIYEMVTGRKAFEGKSSISVMSAILKDTPKPLSTLQPIAPSALDRIVSTCLEKDPDDRWQSARDLQRELQWISEKTPAVPEPARKRPRTVSWNTAALLLAISILCVASAAWTLRSRGATSSPGFSGIAHLSVALQPGERLSIAGPPAAISSDGTTIAYVSQRIGEARLLYLRSINRAESKAVPGTDGATNPFFSPNGQWVAFFAAGRLKKVSVGGAAIETLCEAGNGRGGTWTADDTIYFSPNGVSGLWSIAASGGAPREITTLDRSKGEMSHRFPQVLPGGKAVLFAVWTGPGWDESQLQLLTLATGERHAVVPGARLGRYSSSGHLIYSRNGTDTLLAVPFDLEHLQVSNSPPVTLSESVRDSSESGEFALSDTGTLVFTPGNPERHQSRLVWVDRNGAVEPLRAPPRDYQEPVLSPDGRQIAVSIEGPSFEVSVFDLARSTLTALVSSGSSQAPIWTPDGLRLVYRGTRLGFRNLYWRSADGSSPEERLSEGSNAQTPGTLSSDGKRLLYQNSDNRTAGDIWELALHGNRSPHPLLNTPAGEFNPHLSRDGRWLAYTTDESGRSEVWVRPFPALDGKWKISSNGGTEPVWSRDGKELFYRDGDKMLSAQIAPGATFSASPSRVLFEGAFHVSGTAVSAYDVSLDGQRLLMVQPNEGEQPVTEFHVVLNWFEELKPH